MTNRRSPVLTCWPSVKARFCRKPSTRATRLTVLTACTRPTKVPACVTLFSAAAVTVTAGGGGGADAAWSEVEDRPQPQSAAAIITIAPRTSPPGGSRIVEFPSEFADTARVWRLQAARNVPRAAKPCQCPGVQDVGNVGAASQRGILRGPHPIGRSEERPSDDDGLCP